MQLALPGAPRQMRGRCAGAVVPIQLVRQGAVWWQLHSARVLARLM